MKSSSSIVSTLWSVFVVTLPLSKAFLSNTGSQRRTTLTPASKNIFQRSQPWIQRLLVGLQYSTEGNSKQNKEDDQTAALGAYQTVAEQDPQWYDKFVINVLGEKVAEEIGLPKAIPTAFSMMERKKADGTTADVATSETIAEEKIQLPAAKAPEIANKTLERADSSEEENSGVGLESSSSMQGIRPVMVENVKALENTTEVEKSKAELGTGQMQKPSLDTPAQSLEETSAAPPPDALMESERLETTKVTAVEEKETSQETRTQEKIKLPKDDSKPSPKSDIVSKDTSVESQEMETAGLKNLTSIEVSEDLASNDAMAKQEAIVEIESNSDKFSGKYFEETKSSASKSESAELSSQESNLPSNDDSKVDLSSDVVISDEPTEFQEAEKFVETDETLEAMTNLTSVEVAEDPAKKIKPMEEKEPTGKASPSAQKDSNKRSQKESLETKGGTSKDPPSDSTVEDVVVVYKGWVDKRSLMISEPLSKLISLGYTKGEILRLQSDALDLILANNIAKPKSGIPRHWRVDKVEASDVQIMENSAFQELKKEKRQKRPPQRLEDPKGEPVRSDESNVITTRNRATSSSSFPPSQSQTRETQKGENVYKSDSIGFVEDEPKAKPEEAGSLEAQSTTNEVATSKLESAEDGRQTMDGNAVVYFDSVDEEMRMAPLKSLTALGYSKEEILELRPNALATIYAERMPRPSKGVPPKWRNPKAKRNGSKFEVVQVMPPSEALALVTTDRDPSNNRNSRSTKSDRQARREPDVPGKRPRVSERQRARSRERSAFNTDGSKKTVFNGRQRKESVGKRRQVPGPPKGWIRMMDYDTFRDLLRNEAEMRLRITDAMGGDFSGAIKEECEMRLGLYEGWLRTLNRGIGQPIVPSRSERRVGVPRKIDEDSEGRRKPARRRNMP